MRIGIDFDNTIVSYDHLFYQVAVEGGHVPPEMAPSKLKVRDYLRDLDREVVWTRMQGLVYGARMNEAELYPGALDCLRWARDEGLEVSIISHKTRYPYLGPRYDLHEAARRWIDATLRDERGALVAAADIHFELTKAEKIRRVASARCDCFIDDLPEILISPDFPGRAVRILFDPDATHPVGNGLFSLRSWTDIHKFLEARCPTKR